MLVFNVAIYIVWLYTVGINVWVDLFFKILKEPLLVHRSILYQQSMTKSMTLKILNPITVWLGLWWFMEATNRTIHLFCWSNYWNFRIWLDDGSLWSCIDNQDCHCEYIDHRIRYTICKWILYVFCSSIFDGFKLSNIFHMHSHVK